MGILGEISLSLVVIGGIGLRLITKDEKLYGRMVSLGVVISVYLVLKNKVIEEDVWSYKGDSLSNIGKILSGVGGVWVLSKRLASWQLVVMSLGLLGVWIMSSSVEIMLMYIGIELSGLSWYILSGSGSEVYSKESGLKYFIVGGVGSGLILLGGSMIYNEVGTLKLEEIAQIGLGEDGDGKSVGLGLIISGLGIKIGSGPVHQWKIDVYEGAESKISKVLGVVPMIGVICLLVRWQSIVEENDKTILGIVGVLGISSIVIGSLGGVHQRRGKRFMAYSSVGNVGLVWLGIFSGAEEELMKFVGIYMMTTWLVWEIIEKKEIRYIEEVSNLGKWLGGVLCLGMFSLGGVPPLLGFVGKWSIFESLIVKGSLGSLILLCVGLLGSVISGYYYVRWVKVVVNEEPKALGKSIVGVEGEKLSIVVLMLILGIWGVWW